MKNLPQISSELNKSQIKSIAQNCVTELLENGNPIGVAEMISKMELFIKDVKADERYIDYVRSELAKWNHKFTSESGTKIESAEVGIKYDYSLCNDYVWKSLDEQLQAVTLQKKDREEFLKTIPHEGMDIIDSDGVVSHIDPPVKTSTSSYKVTIAK